MDNLINTSPLWREDIDYSAIGKKIYATNPYVGGYINSIEPYYCKSCKTKHFMYKSIIQCGLPVTMYICPTNTIKIDNSYFWLRSCMTSNDPDYQYFGAKDKVVSDYIDTIELDNLQKQIQSLKNRL